MVLYSSRLVFRLSLLVWFLLIPSATGAQSTLVYSNTIPAIGNYQRPGAGIFVSDDVTMADSASVSMLEIMVQSMGTASYNATITLFSSDLCVGTPTQIPNSSKTFAGILAGNDEILSAVYSPPIDVPPNFFVRVVFTDSNAGWVVAGAPEVGSSADQICQDQTGGGGNPGYLNLGGLQASMWIQVWEDTSTPVLPKTWGLLKGRYLDP